MINPVSSLEEFTPQIIGTVPDVHLLKNASQSHFCFGSDLLWHHKDKHQNNAKSSNMKWLLEKHQVDDLDIKHPKLSIIDSPNTMISSKQILEEHQVENLDDKLPKASNIDASLNLIHSIYLLARMLITAF